MSEVLLKSRAVNVLIGLLLIGCSLFFLWNLKTDSVIVEVRYLLEACEKCTHFEVENSSDSSLVGATIIVLSDEIDVESLINDYLSNRQNICLRGEAYRFNPNVLGIRPDGIRFAVNHKTQLSECKSLTKP